MLSWKKPEAGLFVLRLSMGAIFFLHGWMKLFGGQESFMREMLKMVGWSIPDALLLLVTFLELLGGLALLFGLLTRPAAILLAVEMIVAVVLFHARQGFFIVAIPNVPLAYGFEYQLALVGGLICLAFAGPGIWSAEEIMKTRGASRAAGI